MNQKVLPAGGLTRWRQFLIIEEVKNAKSGF